MVVGNPPYITVKDKMLNSLYRDLYKSCAGPYALSVPFAERFFQLAKNSSVPGNSTRGYVGQITSNSFMKREAGKRLIEEFFAHKVELTEVIDTSGAHVPEHGTPTVILIGRPRSGSRSETIRTVRGVQGEPNTPEGDSAGLVWEAISDLINVPGSTGKWVSVDDLERQRYFGKQPWILSDGGLEMVEGIEKTGYAKLTSAISPPIGRAIRSGADDAFIRPIQATLKDKAKSAGMRPLLTGEDVRDWGANPKELIWYPYDSKLNTEEFFHQLWPLRRTLESRRTFQGDMADAGLHWWVYMQHTPSAYTTALSIPFSFVSTHNHFALNRGGTIFNQKSPVIKLHKEATEEDHIQLLGLLNSSTACFWLKQTCFDRGHGGVGGGIASEAWEKYYEFTGSALERFPLPSGSVRSVSSAIESLTQEIAITSPSSLAASTLPTLVSLRDGRAKWHSTRAQMIALQEELDWQVYSLYKLHAEDLRAPESEVPELALGERAFEIVLARRVEKKEASGEWFKRHGSTPITEMPDHWSDAYKAVVQKRIDVIESSRAIGMVERPEYKRRWATEGWDVLQERALKSWLLDRIEKRDLWFQDEQPTLLTRAQLTSALSLDENFVSVAELYAPRKELATVVAELLTDEHVPFLPALRYKPSGLKKRADWEHVWELQREEDAAPDEPAKRKIRDSVPVPPKYTSADFLKASYWRARGKLDVPKERFISYATGAISGTPDLFGWAGWDHREQAQALTTYFTNDDGLSSEEMVPLLAGVLELQPWLDQWHNEFDPLYGSTPAAFFAGYRATQQGEHGLTDDDLRAWRPAPAARRGRRPAGS